MIVSISIFDKFISDKRVFSRVTPTDKLHIVESFKRQGEFVAVTGDGVNDAPAIKAANIGVASAEGRGSIKAGTLEMSNVDLSEQFTDMIVTQRGFQSNARTITTADQMLQEVIALKR